MTNPDTESCEVSPAMVAEPSAGGAVDQLLGRVTAGDREAIATLALTCGPLIRRRISGKLGPRIRRMFDSEDIMSTVLRRLDRYASEGRLQVATHAQFIALLREISEAAVVDKARVVARLERVERSDESLAHALRRSLASPDPDSTDSVLAAAFAAIDDEADRRILWHWLTGREHASTAELLNMSPASVRQRWKRIRDRVRSALERDAA